MKVLQINALYGHGSTGVIVRDIEQLCWQNGIECYVVSPDSKVREAKRGYIIGNVLDYKLHALLCRIHGKQAYFSHIPTMKLCHYIDQIKPDVVHLHNLHSNYIHLNFLLKHLAKKGIKTVVTLHDCWFFTGGCFHYTSARCDKWREGCGGCPKRFIDTPAYLGDLSSQILQDRIKHFNIFKDLTIVGVSDWISNEVKNSRIKANSVLTIHNGVDLSVFRPMEPPFKTRFGIEGKFVILCPASKWFQNINKETLDYFIEKMSSDMVLLLFGCSEKKEGFPKNVIQLEFTRNRKELAVLYSSADVLVNCSREDTLSTINLEAQACGTPVVTYEATGSAETVDGKCGYAIETGNFDLLFKGAMKIKEKGKDYFKDSCRSFIQTNFNKEKRYEDYIDLFNKLTLL